MKRTLNYLGVLAVAAMTLASCKQELNPSVNENGTHKVTIIPSMTKTVIDESGDKATVNWTTNETVHAYENGYKATEAILVSNDNGRTAIINAEFTDKAAASYTYNAIVAKSVSDSKNPLLSNTQTATATSFDSDADILISSFSEPVAESTDHISLYFARPVVINKMTLQGLTEGEKIKSVEFTASCYLAGRFKINFATGNVEEYGVSEQKKNIVVSYKNNEAAAADGTFPVYFVSFPTLTDEGCGDFSVVVRTNKFIYTKNVSGKKLEFKLDMLTKFKMDLSTAEKEEVFEDVVYTLVQNQNDLCDGAEYIIVAAGSAKAMGQYTGGNNHPQKDITKVTEGGVTTVTTNNASGVLPIRIDYNKSENEVDYYTLSNASSDTYAGYYLSKQGSNSNNYLKEVEAVSDIERWSISISNGVATITNKGAAPKDNNPFTIRYNSSNSIFSSYPTGQADVALYVNKATCIEKVDAPEIDAEQTGAGKVTVVWQGVEHAAEYTVSCGDVSETYAAGEDLYEHSFTGLSNKKYTIVVEAVAESGWRNNSSSEDVTVVNVNLANPSVVFEGISTSAFTAKWSAVSNAASYNYYVADAEGNRLPAYSDDVNTENLTFTVEDGLAAGTTYKVFIKTVAPSESIFVAPENYAEFDVTTEQEGVSYSYKKVSTITDGEYIIVCGSYYLPNTQTTSASPIAQSITILNNKVTGTIAEDMKWLITTSGTDGKTLTIKSAAGDYLFISGTNNTSIRVGTTQDTWALESNTVDAFAIKDASKSRYCAAYSASGTNDWRSYTSATATNYVDGGKLYFYKKITDAPATPLSAPANLTCSAQSEDQLTFTWSEVSNATGYKVSTDGGNTYGDLIKTTSYTWINLSSSTEYTLYVKAIGDGETWSDSEASHASGTTSAATVWNLKSIAVTTQPTKKEYSVGDNFDPTGMVVTATYSDAAGKKADKTAPVTGYTMNPQNKLSEGTYAITITYSEGGVEKTAQTTDITVRAGGGDTPTDYTTTFSSGSWANTNGDTMSWTSNKAGGFVSAQGVQVTTNNTGANATTKKTFTNVSKIVVTYSTNASKGAGTIAVKVGSGSAKEFSVTKPSSSGTTDKTTEFTFSPNESGAVNLTVTCTTNSVYIKKVVVTATGAN